jgi:two-component system nitrogen regulation response regulator GlnG
VDVRVLAATDADLEARVAAGEFRAPLLHRLGGYEIWLPPLRERRDDIGRLLVHFLRRELAALDAAHLLEPDAPLWLPADLVARLALYHWPGNVRQLRNVARQIAIASRAQPRAEIGPAVERLLREAAPRPAEPPQGPAAERRRPAEVPEAELIEALHACRWDLQAAAERLRISRPSLYALVEANPRLRKAGDLSPEEIARCWEECGGDVETMVERLEVSRKALARRLRELKLT